MIRVIYIWLVRSDGMSLLARRADDKAHDPGLWGPAVTGKFEPGETAEQTLAREVKEEINLDPSDYELTFLFDTDFKHPDGNLRHFYVYFGNIKNGAEEHLKIDPVEVAEVKWLSIKEVREFLKTIPGELIPNSAFLLWDKIFNDIKIKGFIK